ncbi:MAG TPA: hypothetical protein VFZ93_07175 [Albitalea sp.]
MSNYTTNPLAVLATLPVATQKKGEGGFFEAMAKAWGDTLDAQASRITQQSDLISGGADTPSALTELQTQSLKMGFMSQASHTSISSVGSALETMARKQ